METSKEPLSRQFTTTDFHEYLVDDRESPNELLPKMIELPEYTPQIGKMYEEQKIRGELDDLSIPFTQRLESPGKIAVAGERMCLSYVDMNTPQYVVFREIYHGKVNEIDRRLFEFFKQRKFPLCEIHTHPEDIFFSARDLIILCMGTKDVRFLKAAMLLNPQSQVLALATTDTPKYNFNQAEIVGQQAENQLDNDINQVKSMAMERLNTGTSELVSEFELLKTLLKSGQISPYEATERSNQLSQQAYIQADEDDRVDLGDVNKTLNQDLLKFAYENGIKLYFSTDRRTFREFSA